MYTVYRSPAAFYECLITVLIALLYTTAVPLKFLHHPLVKPPPLFENLGRGSTPPPLSNFIFIVKFLLTGFRAFLQINFPWVFPDFLLFSSIFPLSSGDKKYIIFNDNVEGNILTNESMFYFFFWSESCKRSETFIDTNPLKKDLSVSNSGSDKKQNFNDTNNYKQYNNKF